MSLGKNIVYTSGQSKVVQERLGHSQNSITLDTYSHVLPSMQQDAVRKIDEALDGED